MLEQQLKHLDNMLDEGSYCVHHLIYPIFQVLKLYRIQLLLLYYTPNETHLEQALILYSICQPHILQQSLISCSNQYMIVFYLTYDLIQSIVYLVLQSTMDLFQFPDDYKPEKPLTDDEMDEITNYLKNHPLFMKQAPENIEDNEHLVALQHLVGDEDPNTAAENLNNQASNRLKQKPQSVLHMKDAYKKYTEGILIKCTSPSINAKLHSNRAAINLKLKNYGKVIQDCQMCLKYDSNYVKAYYRQAKALNGLRKFEQTVKLLKDRNEPQLIEIRKETLQIIEKQNNKNNLKISAQQAKSQQIKQYCINRKWNLLPRSKNEQLPPNTKLKMIDGRLSIPIIVFYPQFNQFDVIQRSFEEDKIKSHTQQLFKSPLPYDHQQQYNINNIQIYAQIGVETLLKIPKQCTIRQILERAPLKECLEICIVSNGNSFYKKYIQEHKII